MRYVSTRGTSQADFRGAVMAGLAPDGGLFVPEAIPEVNGALPQWRALSFTELFQAVIAPYVGEAVPRDTLHAIVERAFAAFTHPHVTPVVPLGPLYLAELFHGPTLAFKDIALQFLGHLFEHFLSETGERLTIAGATSGDTGSAAIHALKGRRNLEAFILFPKGRVSRMQQLQMTTVADANIHCVAVEGTFDDAQDLVKGMFNDRAFNGQFHLSAVNSINWARVMAQITYFFFAYFRIADLRPGMRVGDPIRVTVPTGNFGHIFAAVLARRMGLPIAQLVLATNANSILHRFVRTGEYRKGQVVQTLSPSMDIQVASNFERYLFDVAGGDGGRVAGWLAQLRDQGGFTLPTGLMRRVWGDFTSAAVDDRATLATIRTAYRRWNTLLDPHSAVGVHAALALAGDGLPTLAMATAHPAKFGDAIRRAVGFDPPMPPPLAELESLPERFQILPARLDAVQGYVRSVLS